MVGSTPSLWSVTVTVTSRSAVLNAASWACTVTLYTLSRPESVGFSKSGGLVKERAPVSLMVKALLSVPDRPQETSPPSGSVARKVYRVEIRSSGWMKAVRLVVVMMGASSTSVTVTLCTSSSVPVFRPSDARIVTS